AIVLRDCFGRLKAGEDRRASPRPAAVRIHDRGCVLLVLVVVYCLVFGTAIVYMLKLIVRGPMAAYPPKQRASSRTVRTSRRTRDLGAIARRVHRRGHA